MCWSLQDSLSFPSIFKAFAAEKHLSGALYLSFEQQFFPSSMTTDGWFTHSTSPPIFLLHALLRSVEKSLPMGPNDWLTSFYCTSQLVHFKKTEVRTFHQQKYDDMLSCNTCFIMDVLQYFWGMPVFTLLQWFGTEPTLSPKYVCLYTFFPWSWVLYLYTRPDSAFSNSLIFFSYFSFSIV